MKMEEETKVCGKNGELIIPNCYATSCFCFGCPGCGKKNNNCEKNDITPGAYSVLKHVLCERCLQGCPR